MVVISNIIITSIIASIVTSTIASIVISIVGISNSNSRTLNTTKAPLNRKHAPLPKQRAAALPRCWVRAPDNTRSRSMSVRANQVPPD